MAMSKLQLGNRRRYQPPEVESLGTITEVTRKTGTSEDLNHERKMPSGPGVDFDPQG